MSGEEDSFAGRWSRLKQEAKAAPNEEPPVEADEQVAADAAAEEKTDTEILEELGLPDPENMVKGDDFSAFMSSAVPTRLRNRALRRLWLSNPVLANLDMLVDYGEDFTDAATVVENMQTAYQVGRGFLDQVSWLAEEEEVEPSEDDEALEDESDEPEEDDPEAAEAEDVDPVAEDEPVAEEEPLAPRKSMRFTFDDSAA